jgi:hypothetical protein
LSLAAAAAKNFLFDLKAGSYLGFVVWVSFEVVFRAKVANKTAIVILSIVCEEDHPHKTEQNYWIAVQEKREGAHRSKSIVRRQPQQQLFPRSQLAFHQRPKPPTSNNGVQFQGSIGS